MMSGPLDLPIPMPFPLGAIYDPAWSPRAMSSFPPPE
jgi:hypothetical protein